MNDQRISVSLCPAEAAEALADVAALGMGRFGAIGPYWLTYHLRSRRAAATAAAVMSAGEPWAHWSLTDNFSCYPTALANASGAKNNAVIVAPLPVSRCPANSIAVIGMPPRG
jgi:hypothetical protein